MLEDLKIAPNYDGFLFLAETIRNPPFLFRSHRHAELELNLVTEGEISYIFDGKRYRFGKRTLLWLFPSQEHQLVDRTSDSSYYIAVFTPKMIKNTCQGKRYEALKSEEISESGILHTELEPSTFDLVRKSMDAMVVDGLGADVLNKEAGFGLSEKFSFSHQDPDWLNASLRHLLLLCWRNQQGRPMSTQEVSLHPSIRKSIELMNDPLQPDDLSFLAQQCNLSESYLSRMFHKQVGVNLSRYRNSIRLSMFWECYNQPHTQTILEAIYEAGFGSYPQFYRVFCEAYGKGPREFQLE